MASFNKAPSGYDDDPDPWAQNGPLSFQSSRRESHVKAPRTLTLPKAMTFSVLPKLLSPRGKHEGSADLRSPGSGSRSFLYRQGRSSLNNQVQSGLRNLAGASSGEDGGGDHDDIEGAQKERNEIKHEDSCESPVCVAEVTEDVQSTPRARRKGKRMFKSVRRALRRERREDE